MQAELCIVQRKERFHIVACDGRAETRCRLTRERVLQAAVAVPH
jgi:phage replication-related protein YjqB (UPF0714/DUF867 family)